MRAVAIKKTKLLGGDNLENILTYQTQTQAGGGGVNDHSPVILHQ